MFGFLFGHFQEKKAFEKGLHIGSRNLTFQAMTSIIKRFAL